MGWGRTNLTKEENGDFHSTLICNVNYLLQMKPNMVESFLGGKMSYFLCNGYSTLSISPNKIMRFDGTVEHD
jgi:hypothetical protein